MMTAVRTLFGKRLSTLGAALVVALACSLATLPAKAMTLDFSFSFFDLNGAGQVDGIISGLMDDTAGQSATSVKVTSANYGVGEYTSGATFNLWTVSGGVLTSANFLSTVSNVELSLFGILGEFDFSGYLFDQNTCVDCAPEISSVTLAPVPIPAALPLFATGLAGMGFIGWRRKRLAAA